MTFNLFCHEVPWKTIPTYTSRSTVRPHWFSPTSVKTEWAILNNYCSYTTSLLCSFPCIWLSHRINSSRVTTVSLCLHSCWLWPQFCSWTSKVFPGLRPVTLITFTLYLKMTWTHSAITYFLSLILPISCHPGTRLHGTYNFGTGLHFTCVISFNPHKKHTKWAFLFLDMRDAKLKPREVTEVSRSRTDGKQQCQNLIPRVCLWSLDT